MSTMTMRPLFFLAVLLSIATWTAHAQMIEVTQGELNVYAGVTSPTGDFSDDVGDIDNGNGYAMLGFGITGEYVWPIGPPGLGWVSGGSVIINRFDGEKAFDLSDNDVDLSPGYWLNVPIMTGLKYEAEASPTVDVYGLGQLGVNLNKGPSTSIEDDFGNSAKTSYGTVPSLGLNLGAGIVIDDRYIVGLRYKRLGEPEIEIESEVETNLGDVSAENAYDQPLSMVQLLVGISFR